MYQDGGGRSRRLRVDLDAATRGRVERGAQTALLTAHPPRWTIGDTLVVVRHWRPVIVDGVTAERQDAALTLTVDSVLVVEPGRLTPGDAHRLGHRTLPDLHRHLVGDGHPLTLKGRVDKLPLHWLTGWSLKPTEELRLLGPTLGYVQSKTSPQMASAGEAVPDDWQEERAATAEREFNRPFREGRAADLAAQLKTQNALRAMQERARRRTVLGRSYRVEEAA